MNKERKHCPMCPSVYDEDVVVIELSENQLSQADTNIKSNNDNNSIEWLNKLSRDPNHSHEVIEKYYEKVLYLLDIKPDDIYTIIGNLSVFHYYSNSSSTNFDIQKSLEKISDSYARMVANLVFMSSKVAEKL